MTWGMEGSNNPSSSSSLYSFVKSLVRVCLLALTSGLTASAKYPHRVEFFTYLKNWFCIPVSLTIEFISRSATEGLHHCPHFGWGSVMKLLYSQSSIFPIWDIKLYNSPSRMSMDKVSYIVVVTITQNLFSCIFIGLVWIDWCLLNTTVACWLWTRHHLKSTCEGHRCNVICAMLTLPNWILYFVCES